MNRKPIALPIPFTLVLLGGAGVCFLASMATARDATLPPLLRLLPPLAVMGLVVVALVERLKAAAWDFPARVETAVHTAAASAVCVFTSLAGVPKEWDSMRLLLAAAFVFLLLATVAILLPAWPRKVMITCWIFWHFGGMFAVFASIDPPNGSGSWLAKQAWTFAFRPYLQFLYLTNAYHFYSPDPGPPTLLWFSVEYKDGSRQWVKIPSRGKSPVGMHYQRLLALPEHSFSPQHHVSPPRTWDVVYTNRYNASSWRSKLNGLPIPMVADLDQTRQFREPTDVSRRVLGSVCKAVLLDAPKHYDKAGEEVPAVTVKAYRIVHLTLSPYELKQGADPFDKGKYWAYYLGQHDLKGNMIDDDPFLYWYLPLAYVPKNYPDHHKDPKTPVTIHVNAAPVGKKARDKDWKMLDCLEMHAEGMVFPGMPMEKKP
ncbi:MAG: hypothetical protein K2W96_11340 [Gemmataceae bacterium]|nr:hypothetical protein [Gemmataceae bacterium]